MFTTLYSVKVLYLTFLTNPNGPLINYKNAHEGDIFMSSPLMVLAVFSIFFGFVTKDMFIGLGSGFFSDNALFIHPIHEIMLDTEFAVSTVFKLLPLMFTISLSVIAIILSEFLSTTLISFKLSRTGYNIFSFFNQRFLIELFYNRFLSGIVLKLGGQTTKVLDKGSVEYIGPYGLEKGLLNISSNISNLNTGSVTTYALFITTGVVCYILFFSYVNLNIVILNILLALSLVLFSSKTPVDAILKSSMVGDTFMTLTQISGRSLREVVAGVCANEGHIVAIGQCSHAPLSTITPTAMELSQGQVPDCDTGITGVDTRHSALNGSDSFYSCHKCFGVWCRNCKFLDMLPLMVASPTCKLAYGDRLTI
ncbi:MAG: hypothetical protein EOP34_07340 [Rickettsiales bacterium]|nr:MAG: hypothetical protein EOP34_07340 [Rickettsiales bacterium]